MISRIYVAQSCKDSREGIYQKSFNRLNIGGKVTGISVVDAYTIDAKLSKQELLKTAEILTNPNLESYSISSLPFMGDFSFICEIGYLPGVTDNVGSTAKEEIADALGKKISDINAVYTSKLFLISGKLSDNDLKTIALSLHNPLIERYSITQKNKIKKDRTIEIVVPKVSLPKKTAVINVSLDVSDAELEKIGKEGITDPDGTRRGPLALDLLSMKAIQKFFKENMKRDPTDIELESLAQTWSEHCKHTIFANPIDDIKEGLYKKYIKGATNEIRKQKGKKDFCISVFSDNSGGIVFDKDYMITHKVETHNSPSALDPFGGAITGIVGVNRDTIGFGMGAKPVANTYGFCFGYPEDKRPFFKDKNLTERMLPAKRIIDGVIKGVNVGGNCSGIPTVSGFVRYDDRFRGKPLVFVGTIGLIPRKIKGKLSHEKKARPGDYVVMIGGKVGADGIHGATFSSVVMDSTSPATAVQIGDPITQKKLSDAIVKEARDQNLYTSITDNGAGGISCSVAEMAKECGGAIVDIDKVPLKYPGLLPWQIWISESQERMTLSVPKNKWKKFQSLMDSRGVLATRIGEFTSSGKCVVRHKGKVIMNMPMEFLHNGLPMRDLKTEKTYKNIENPEFPKDKNKTNALLTLLESGNIGSFKWISEQYDHEVQAGSVIKPISGRGQINTDAQVVRPLLSSKKGVVLSSGEYPSYSDISTYHMASCAIDTAIRQAIASGASLDNLAILDNFCWCSSYDKGRLAELVESIQACYKYAVGYGTPFISGKDSMFNDFKGYDEKGNPVAISIPPTLLISAIGVVPEVEKCVTPEFKMAGDLVYILGETNEELGASEYTKMIVKNDITKIGRDVPKVDLVKNKRTYKVLESAIKKGIIASSVSVGSGGLGVALAKASVGGMLGVNASFDKLPGKTETIDGKLFSESQGRIIVSISPKNKKAFENITRNIPCVKIGIVSNGGKFVITDKKTKVINTDIKNLSRSYHKFSNKMK